MVTKMSSPLTWSLRFLQVGVTYFNIIKYYVYRANINVIVGLTMDHIEGCEFYRN